jgi:flagellar hook-associated protein 2
MDLGVSGLVSGFDWRSLVEQLVQVERAPQQRLRADQSILQQRNTAYSSIKTQLDTLKTKAAALKEATLFDSRLASSSDTTIASATATVGAIVGTYTFNITQLATAAAQLGQSDVGSPLSATDDVSTLVLSNAGFSTPVTAGTFTVNGKTVTIETTDTLQGVFDKISTATSGAVTGSYSAATDKITLTSASPIVLGSDNDTSNFLQVARLNFNGTGTVTSSLALGGARLSSALTSSNLKTAISGGAGGTGEFKINGVSITFNPSTDTLSSVMARINSSTAGVTASYDSVNDRFVLTNKATGDRGVALEDVTGNFLAATGLSNGTLQRGQNLLYTVNGGGTLSSQSNTIADTSSGLTGLSVSVLDTGSVTVQVSSDVEAMKTAIEDFVTAYNQAHSLIDTNTASSTDSTGKVTAGILAAETQANDLSRQLRGLMSAQITGLSGSITRFDQLGYASNGYDNALVLSESETLDHVLSEHLNEVKDFFANETNGFAVEFDQYLDATVGEDGTLVEYQDNLTDQATDIDDQIAEMERIVQLNRQQLIDSFVAMETARSKIDQQMQFLQQTFAA